MSTPPLGDERRAAIADAALGLVATRGLRGLTHRAVDAEAGLPPGSTSYYLRTRDALLTACVERLLQRDLDAGITRLPEGADLPDLLTAVVVDITVHRAPDMLARYELMVEATRRPRLRAALVAGGTRLRALLATALGGLGLEDAETYAWPLAALLDGLIYDRLAGAGSILPADQFAAAVHLAVATALAGMRVTPVPWESTTADRDQSA